MTQIISPALQNHLDSGATTLCWCWRLIRTDGAVFGFTDHDRLLTFDGTSFEPESGFTASEIRASTDLAVDAQDAQGALQSDRITETDILDGRWDAATVELWRVNWQDTDQRALMRLGSTGEIRRGKVAFTTEVRSLAFQLSQPVGRTYQYSCDATVGDARCGVDLNADAYLGAATVTAIESGRRIITTDLATFAQGWFSQGILTWTGGANAGRRAMIRVHEVRPLDVAITLMEMPVRAAAVGDTFEVRAGCDQQFRTCRDKFSNGLQFRGCPDIPGPDTMTRYATPGSGGDGGTL